MFYSASTNAFYPPELRTDYENAGSWPDDAREVDLTIYSEFAAGQAPAGMHRVAGLDGLPMWEQLPPAPPYVPEQVTRAQGKAALITAGLWQDVLDYVDSITDPTEKALALVALNDTTHWQRTSPFLNEAAASLGLSDGQLDGLFVQASEIQL